jgi:hypothetical protein
VPFDLRPQVALQIDDDIANRLPGQVALTVSLEIQTADAAPPRHRIFPDAGVYSAALPRDVALKPNVH